MKDQAANVRKNALRLFSVMINKYVKQSFDLASNYRGELPSQINLEKEIQTYSQDLEKVEQKV
jgi:hypothetical protein